jgi:uncharacterized protein
MNMTGEHRIAALRGLVWCAQNTEGVLRACIPGYTELEKKSDIESSSAVVRNVGPVKAKCAGDLELKNINSPASYIIQGEGFGGVSGFAKGGADVNLEADGDETVLPYVVNATVRGKLAQFESRLIDSTVHKAAAKFFDNYHAHFNENQQDNAG